jgi:type VI secretion system Hcp family effector
MMLAVAVPASATDVYCTVVGTQIAVYALTQELKIPFDATSGQRSGQRQHSPVTIIKELDKSSPLFFNAAEVHWLPSEFPIRYN